MRFGFAFLFLSLTLAKDPLSRAQTRPLISELNKQMSYFRMELDERSLSFSNIENNNTLFTMPIKSRRNNYEEIILLSYGCIGRSIQNQLQMNTGTKEFMLIPSIVSIDCTIPLGRDNTQLATSINHKTAVQFAEGLMSSQEFWQEIMNSAETSSNMNMIMRTPEIFMTDVDFENLIAARIALEGKGNPKIDNILSLASKASYVPGLQSKLENMLVDHMKTKHISLMTRVLGYEPAEDQIVRIGKQFFYHAQKPYIEVKEIHISDSLRYVWKGNKYPQVLDQHYQAYRLQQD
ncbi:MAG: hypothetical protein VX537_07200 [Candidatus Neomarinimicrobiota bacterium]|nr:hypothetical protein [Candidatus Neomarinimicrobiota bacterium]